jgi:predicted nucleic acid-binding protein
VADQIVIYDSCIFYSFTLRNLFVQLAMAGLYRAKWSEEIHQEWMSSLLRDRPDLSQEKVKKIKNLIDKSVPDCLVKDYEPLVDKLELPDAEDRHVLAAAIQCGAQTIVTNNLKDFPERILNRFNIEIMSPDHFLSDLWDFSPEMILHSLKKCRERLVNPPFTSDEYLQSLTKHGFIRSVARLRPFESII